MDLARLRQVELRVIEPGEVELPGKLAHERGSETAAAPDDNDVPWRPCHKAPLQWQRPSAAAPKNFTPQVPFRRRTRPSFKGRMTAATNSDFQRRHVIISRDRASLLD
jgi:hypothetical protein